MGSEVPPGPVGRRVHPPEYVGGVILARDSAVGGASAELEFRYRRADGGYRWMSGRSREVIDDDGMVTGRVIALRDVDELVGAREQLEGDRARLSATLASLLHPHVLLIAVRDAEGSIVDFTYSSVNDAACDYMRMEHSELDGARLLDVLPGQAGSGMLAMYASAVESGEPLLLDDYAYPHEILQDERRYDIRGIRVGDALSFTWRDVTDRYEAGRALAEREEEYRLLADNSSDVVMHVRDGLILWVSLSLTDMLGWDPADWPGGLFDDFIHVDDRSRLVEARLAIRAGATVVDRFRARDKEGGYHWIETHARPYRRIGGEQDGAAVSFRTVGAEVEAEAALERRAQYDELTGLINRKELFDRFAAIIGRQRRAGDVPAVIFCDIDDFKGVNDTYGHAAGDELLRCLSARISDCVRASDLVARLG